MPIPTRSQSVKAATGLSKPGRAQRSEDPNSTDSSVVLSSTTSQKSRLPGPDPGRSIPTRVPGHTRSQSSSLATPRSTTVRTDTQLPIKLDGSTQAAHARSRSIATPPLGKSQIQRPQPTQPLLRNRSQATRAPFRANLPPQPVRQIPAPKTSLSVTKQPLEDSAHSTSILPISSKASTSPAAAPLEDELLQLAIVHQNSYVTLRNFEESVNHKIKASTVAIEAEEEVLRTAERLQQANLNARAVQGWMLRIGNLRDLGFCLTEISDLTSATGSYTMYMITFEDWLKTAHDAHQQRSHGTDMYLVEPMDHLRADAQEIETRLVACEHVLQCLQCDVEDRSALAWVLKRLPVSCMRRAVAESQMVYEAVLSTQSEWIDETISNMVVGDNDHRDPTTRLGLWST